MDLCMVNIPNGASGKESPTGAEDIRDAGSIPGSGRSPGGGNDNPLQYSCLENSMDRGAWQATVHGMTKTGMLLLLLLSRFSLIQPCNLMDRSLPGSSVHGILQARILQWVAMPSSRGSA